MLKLAKANINKVDETKHQNCLKEEKLYVGIDVHHKQWNITIVGRDREIMKGKTIPPDPTGLIKLIQSRIKYKEVHIAYEAGFCGFWIQRELEKLGAKAIVVNPADIPSSDKDTRQKTDKGDSYKIATTLRAGLLKAIYVPTQEEEEHQAIIRRRTDLVSKRTRIKNNIKGYIKKHGIKINCSESAIRDWGRDYIATLKQYANSHSGHKYQIESMLRELQFYQNEITQIDKELTTLMSTEKYKKDYKHLKTVPGVAKIVASTFLLELYNIERFDSFSKFASYIGIIPTEHSSGDKQRTGRMTKRSRTKVKSLLIESAWIAIRTDLAFKEYYNKLHFRMPAQKAIIHCSRKLLARIYHILKNKEEYKPTLVAA